MLQNLLKDIIKPYIVNLFGIIAYLPNGKYQLEINPNSISYALTRSAVFEIPSSPEFPVPTTIALVAANITGTITHVGNNNQTGNSWVTGNVTVSQDLDVTRSAQFEEILIDDNFITTTSSNADLELRAAGTGNVVFDTSLEITNNFETFDQYTKSECYKLYPSAKLYRGHQFITICYKDGSKIDLNQLALVDSGNSIPVIVKNNILDTINKLEPVEYIRKSVDELKSKFNDDTITVSIRTYLDAERNIHSNGRFFDINKVFEKMDNELYGDRLFFVTCDHQETFEAVSYTHLTLPTNREV